MRAWTVLMMTIAAVMFGAAQVLTAVAAHMDAMIPVAW